MTEWATLGDVKEITDTVATSAQRRQGVAILEMLTGQIEEVNRPDMSDRDRYWLKLATAYQVAFVADNPDLFSRNDVTSASQDGESASFRNVDAHLLAPLARKAVRRLSWKALTRAKDATSASGRINVNSEEYDDSLPWRPA